MLIVDRVRPGPRSRNPRTRARRQLARDGARRDIAPPEPRADVCLGIEQHDVAWAAYDRRPPLHAETGRAASFIEAPIRERHLIWHDAPERAPAQSPWAALLVSLHRTNIHTRYVSVDYVPAEDADIVRGYLAEQRALQDRLIELAGDDPAGGPAPGRAALRPRRAVAVASATAGPSASFRGRRRRDPRPPHRRARDAARPVAVRRAAGPGDARCPDADGALHRRADDAGSAGERPVRASLVHAPGRVTPASIRRDALAIGLATGAYAISYGVLAVAAGLSVAQTCAMSVLVFTGASQFAVVGVLGAGRRGRGRDGSRAAARGAQRRVRPLPRHDPARAPPTAPRSRI